MKKRTKIITAVSAGVLILAATAGIIATGVLQNKKILPKETLLISDAGIDISDMSVTVIAHMGLSALAPENTYFAVEKAGREGYISVEIDIRETRDGAWVLMRDSTIARMTDGRGKVKNRTYYELLNYTVDNGANIEEYSNVKIAALDQVLGLCAKYGIRPFLNIRQGSTEGLSRLISMLTLREDPLRPVILSEDKDCLVEIRRLSPQTELWLVIGKLTDKNTAWLKENKTITADFDAEQKANTAEKIGQLKQAGIKAVCRNVNSLETLKRMYALGLRSFSTDCILPK